MAARPQKAQTMPMPARVLIVEDHLPQRIFLRELVKRLGAKDVVEAENGRVAMEKLQHRQFDLLLVDLAMPDMDGLQLLGHLKEDRTAIPPVILCSVLPQEPLSACAAWLGAHYDLPVIGGISKPVSSEALINLYASYQASRAKPDSAAGGPPSRFG